MNIIHTDDPKHAPINLDLTKYIKRTTWNKTDNRIDFILEKTTPHWSFDSIPERDTCFNKILLLHSTNVSKIVTL
jgi:hypothetical protein